MAAALPASEPGAEIGDPVLLPQPARVWTALVANGERHIVTGGVRATIRASSVVVAADMMAAPIVTAMPARAGYLFVAEDGTVASSDTFTGTLRRIGFLPPGSGPPTLSRGRLVYNAADETVLTTDGRTPISILNRLPPGRRLDLRFADADHGAVVLDGGGLFRTADGGTTWAGVDLHGEAAWRLGFAADGSDFFVDTTGGRMALAIDGSVRELPATPTDDVAPGATTDADGDLQLLRALVTRFAAHEAGDARAVRAGPTSSVFVQGALYVFPGAAPPLRVPASVPEGCDVRVWGDGLASVCAAGGPSIARLGPGVAPAIATDGTFESIVLSTDGRHAAALGDCGAGGDQSGSPGESSGASRRGFCSLSPSGAWRALAVEVDHPRLLAMAGSRVVFDIAPTARDAGALHVLDVDRGSVTRLRPVWSQADTRLSFRSASITPEGWVTALALVRTGHARDDVGGSDSSHVDRSAHSTSPNLPRAGSLVIASGPAGGALVLHAAPPGGESIGFIDARNGVAAGADASQLWRTRDGGEHWERVPLRVDGDAKLVQFDFPGEPGVPRVTCSPDGCVVAGRVWLPARRAPTVERGAVVAAADAREAAAFTRSMRARDPESETVGATPSAAPTSLVATMNCNAPAPPVPSLLRITGAVHAGGQRQVFATPGVNAAIDAWVQGGRITAQLRWRGADATATLQGSTLASPYDLPEAVSDTSTFRPPRYTLWSATRTGALLERCVTTAPTAPPRIQIPTALRQPGVAPPRQPPTTPATPVTTCQLLWAANRGGFTVLSAPTEFATRAGGRARLDAIVPMASGGIAILASVANDDRTVAAVTVVGTDGRVVSRRAFAYAGSVIHGLALRASEIGYVAARTSEPSVLRFHRMAAGPGEPPAALADVGSGPIAVCGAAVAADATRVFTSSPVYAPQISLTTYPRWTSASFATIEYAAGGACIREMQSWAQPAAAANPRVYTPPAASRGLRLTLGTNGHLGGFSDDGSTTQLVQCQ